MPIDVLRLTPIPVPPLRAQDNLQRRHSAMQYWHGRATSAGRGSLEHETWRRKVDQFLADIEASIYLMGYNPLDHGRRREKA